MDFDWGNNQDNITTLSTTSTQTDLVIARARAHTENKKGEGIQAIDLAATCGRLSGSPSRRVL